LRFFYAKSNQYKIKNIFIIILNRLGETDIEKRKSSY
jgi:hypothetical protein